MPRLHVAPLAWVLGLTLAGAVQAATTGTVHEWEVSTGTTGVLVEDHRVPLVTVRIELPAGSWMAWYHDEHAVEAFEIQKHDPAGALRKRSDELAADLYLSAGTRVSSLGLSCRKVDLSETLELARDVLANRDFDRDELSRWKASRRINWRSSLKEPHFVLRQATARLLFARDDPRREPYEEPESPVTDTERLARTRDALIRLPGRVIGFAGDLTLEEARALAATLLPDAATELPAGLELRLEPLVPRAERPDESTPQLPRLTQTYFAYARESLAILDPDQPASMIADHALGGHFNSRLMSELRHAGGETYGAAVIDEGGLEPGRYALTTFTRSENAAPTEAKLRAVLERFHAEGITEEERALAAGAITGSRAFARQSPSQLLEQYLWERRSGLPHGFADQLAQRAAELPLAEVNAFIRRFYDPGSFTMVKVVPDS